MSKTFDLKKFTNGLNLDLLQQYCSSRKLNFEFLPSDKSLDEAFEQFYSSLEGKQQKEIDLDFAEVNDLTTGQATFLLVEYGKESGITFPEEFDESYSQYDKSMWFYLNERDVFNRVYQEYEFQDMAGWKHVRAVKKEISDPQEKAEKLSSALSGHIFSKQYRGKNCYVRTYPQEKCIYFIAYPEDYAIAEMQYDGKKEPNKLFIKPVDRIFFMYEPNTGRMGVKAKGGKTKIQEYQRLFNSIVLEDFNLLDNDRIFDLNKLKDQSFTFDSPSEYRVKYVKVKSIVIKTIDGKMRLTIDVFDSDKKGMDEIHEMIKRLQLSYDTFFISQAVIKVQFHETGIYRSKDSATVRLNWPNSHNLASKPLDNRVKDLLKIWKLDTDKYEKTS